LRKKISKTTPGKETSRIVKTDTGDVTLRFSFKYFDTSDGEMCPPTFPDGYVHVLIDRLKHLEGWRVREFLHNRNQTIRNHTHDWKTTSRPQGFGGLPATMRDYLGWQFCLSANEYGRVHGIISDDTFYVVWLDRDHRLYPS
jgi:hypothetical protein